MERKVMHQRAIAAQHANHVATEAMLAALGELKAIGDALGTEETGKALVVVAKKAHGAEQRQLKVAEVIRSAYGWWKTGPLSRHETQARLEMAISRLGSDGDELIAIAREAEDKEEATDGS